MELSNFNFWSLMKVNNPLLPLGISVYPDLRKRLAVSESNVVIKFCFMITPPYIASFSFSRVSAPSSPNSVISF